MTTTKNPQCSPGRTDSDLQRKAHQVIIKLLSRNSTSQKTVQPNIQNTKRNYQPRIIYLTKLFFEYEEKKRDFWRDTEAGGFYHQKTSIAGKYSRGLFCLKQRTKGHNILSKITQNTYSICMDNL